MDGGLYLRNFRHYIFDGNGATFLQKSAPAPLSFSGEAPRAAIYCSSSTQYNEGFQYYPPITWWLEGGCDITIENMVIHGANPRAGAPGGTNDPDSAIQLSGVEGALVTNVTVHDVYGDFVTVSGLHEGPGGGGGQPSTDVTVTNNQFNGAGRQGVSTEYVNRVLIANNTLKNVAATVFDTESDIDGGNSDNIDITNNNVQNGNQTYAALLSAQSGANIDNFAFTNNDMSSGAEMRVIMSADIGNDVTFDNVTISGNVATGVDTGQGCLQPAVQFNPGSLGTESNILVANNTIPSSPWNKNNANNEGVATVVASQHVNNLQVDNNYMPLTSTTEGCTFPKTNDQVLPLEEGGNAGPPTMYGSPRNGACGNTEGSAGTVFYGSACTSAVTPPTLPVPPVLPGSFPSTTVTLPSNGDVLTGSQWLDAGATSPFGVSTVAFYLTGEGVNDKQIASTDTPTMYGYLASWDTTTVPDGTYTLESVATDAAGNSASSTGVTVTVDNTGQPVTSVVSPSVGTTVAGTQQWLDAGATSPFGVSTVAFYLTGEGVNDKQIASTDTPTMYGYLASWDTTTVPDGTYTLESVATDAAGNSASGTGVTVTVDNNPAPVTSVVSPSNGGVLTGTEALEATASSGFGVSSVAFDLTGGNLNAALIATATPNTGGYGASWDTTTVPDGTYTLESVATDAAGNSASSTGVAITVDNNPPVTSLVSPSSDAALTGSQWLDASASSDIGVSTVEFCLTGGIYNNAVIASTDTSTMYGYLASWDTTTVPDGTYTLQSVAYDTAGISTESSGVTVTVSN